MSAEMIKASGDLEIYLLHILIVKIWHTGEWPEDWRRTVLIPIPKKGDLQQCSNYRTIPLINHASKVIHGPPLIRPPLQQALSWPYEAGDLC